MRTILKHTLTLEPSQTILTFEGAKALVVAFQSEDAVMFSEVDETQNIIEREVVAVFDNGKIPDGFEWVSSLVVGLITYHFYIN